MFAFVSYAGGMAQYRLYHASPDDKTVRVEHWCQSENGEMVLDDSCQPEVYATLLHAMIAIADII